MALDTNPDYWREFTNLQHVKHSLIREYLNGWFPKLGFWSGRVVYLDTHAGRGGHDDGQSGSPIVALKTLLQHRYCSRILDNSEVRFIFIEHDPDNVQALRQHVSALGDLPGRVHVAVSSGDCFLQLERLLSNLATGHKKMEPAFIFVDPYGFTVPGELLSKLLSAGRVELFVNVIWRELDMALAQAQANPRSGLADTLDVVFGDDRWRSIDRSMSFDDRADCTIDLLREAYGAQWATSVRMLGTNGATRYILAHFTNHDVGRDLMKDCVWKICPDGGFYARRSDNPYQTQLIVPDPDLTPLEDWLFENLEKGPMLWTDLDAILRGELWRSTHLWTVIRENRKTGKIVADGYTGRFSKRANPILELASEGE